jgi:hypothetical protein
VGKFAIIFLLTFTGGIVATLAIDASWGVCVWILEYFFHPQIRWWYHQLPELRYSFLIILSLLLSYFIRNKQYSANRLRDLPQTKWILGMLGMCGLIYFWAAWQEMHLQFLIAYAKLIVIIGIVYKVIDTPVKYERVLWAYMLGGLYIGFLAYSSGRTWGGRLEGIGLADGMDVNAISAAVVAIIPIVLYYVFYEEKLLLRGVSVVFLAFMLNMLILANSRGAFLGLIGSSAYYFFRTYFSPIPGKDKKTVQMVLVACCGVGLFFYLADESFWMRMSTLSEATDQAAVKAGRTYFWLKTFDLVKMHPFGVGIWGYQYLSPQFIPAEMLTVGEFGARRAVHSTIFQSLSEYGYIGIPLAGGMIFSNFIYMWRVEKYLLKESLYKLYLKAISIESAFVSFLIAALFIDLLHAQTMYIIIALIACFGNIFMIKHQRNTERGN